jgi:hypothetical protein
MIGSQDLIFAPGDGLKPGMAVEISLAWPRLLDGRIHLQLVLQVTIIGTKTAKAAGISPNTLLNWMKVPEFQAAYREARSHRPKELLLASTLFSSFTCSSRVATRSDTTPAIGVNPLECATEACADTLQAKLSVQILREAGHLDTRSLCCVVDLGKIPDGLNAAELEQYLREHGTGSGCA